jgi:hypothetical protein
MLRDPVAQQFVLLVIRIGFPVNPYARAGGPQP